MMKIAIPMPESNLGNQGLVAISRDGIIPAHYGFAAPVSAEGLPHKHRLTAVLAL
jgi:hypothetical protein